MPRLQHLGKLALKFQFELHVADLRGLPEGVGAVAVVWERHGHVVRSHAAPTQGSGGGAERLAVLGAKLRSSATLYRNQRRAVFDGKPSQIKIVDVSGGKASVLGCAEFDLAEHATLEAGAPPRVKQLQILRKGGLMLLQMQIASCWLQNPDGGGGLWSDADDSMSDSSTDVRSESGSEASGSSLALTHEALMALEAQQAIAGNDWRQGKPGAKAPMRWGNDSGASKAAARSSELQQLLETTRADVRQAEQRLASLQQRLRTDVIATTEAMLQRVASKPRAEQAKLFHQQLMFVVDQVDRIAYDNGGSIGGGGGVSGIEAEVHQLRRDLAAAKVEMAETEMERAELDHVAHKLNKQLADLAATQH